MARRRTQRRTVPWSRRLGALLLGLGVTLVGLELVLGLAYTGFVAVQSEQNRVEAGEGELRILCVGESTTAVAGDGSGKLLVTRTAYPAQLEAVLRDRVPQVDWRVFNGGIMGGTSSTALQRLETDLEELKPHIVIAMMGIKDTPAEWTPFGVSLPGWLHQLHVVRLGIWLLEDVSLEASPRPVDVHAFSDLPAWAQERFARAGNHIWEPRTTAHREGLDRLKVGVYLLTMGHVASAENVVREVVASDDVGMVLLSRVLAADGRFDEAETVLKRAIEAHPTEAFYGIALADLLRRQHRTDEALRVLDDLGTGRVSDVEAFFAGLVLAEVHLDRKEPDAAVAALTLPAPELPGDQREVLPEPSLLRSTMLGRARLAQEDWAAAEVHLLEALRLEPDRQANMFLLAQLYRRTGRMAEEAELRRQFVARSGRVAEYFELVKLLRLTGDTAGAQAVLEEVVRHTPSLRENYALLYEMTRRSGVQLVVMQYPGFALDSLTSYAPAADDVAFIDNLSVFDANPEGYFFQPTYPQSFSHYTREGASVLATHVADTILSLPLVRARGLGHEPQEGVGTSP